MSDALLLTTRGCLQPAQMEALGAFRTPQASHWLDAIAML